MRVTHHNFRGPANQAKEYGLCVVCKDRVYNHHTYLTTEQGYLHEKCFPEAIVED